MIVSRLVLCAGICLSAIALAGDGLDVRTGLWQITYTSEMHGAPPTPKSVLDKLTPAQRAKLEAASRANKPAAPTTWTEKTCVTAQDLKQGAFKAEQDEDAHCKYTLTSQTRTLQEGTVACAAEGISSKGALHIEALSREQVKGRMTGSGTGFTSSFTLNGKWINASCAGADTD